MKGLATRCKPVFRPNERILRGNQVERACRKWICMKRIEAWRSVPAGGGGRRARDICHSGTPEQPESGLFPGESGIGRGGSGPGGLGRVRAGGKGMEPDRAAWQSGTPGSRWVGAFVKKKSLPADREALNFWNRMDRLFLPGNPGIAGKRRPGVRVRLRRKR